MQIKKTFGEILREKRKEKGYTINELAELIGVSSAIVWHWEKDHHIPSFFAAIDLSDALGLSLNELAGRAEEVERKCPN